MHGRLFENLESMISSSLRTQGAILRGPSLGAGGDGFVDQGEWVPAFAGTTGASVAGMGGATSGAFLLRSRISLRSSGYTLGFHVPDSAAQQEPDPILPFVDGPRISSAPLARCAASGAR